ncbi:MAG: hypothetical protein NBV68_02935 [Erythrobacter sp.]|uniref:hypothetical protein n=1 Tax=Erythrobacter sp. TaxID=1042 RepID=UPI0026005A8A|nr:hypothetical protein [Erythrobacter sp.]MCL9998313.1 hypothetical protein [Erythrobacter sp.]
MPDPDRRTSIDETDAKAGSKEGVVRWVLLISLTGAIVALTLVWVTGALTQGPVESQMNVERKVEAERDQDAVGAESSIDGVLSDDPENGVDEATTERETPR